MDEKKSQYLDHSEYNHGDELEQRKDVGSCPHGVCSCNM
jgi:hypothetical protein